jgi:ribosomal protein S18 acetylase RimI-like enzyme
MTQDRIIRNFGEEDLERILEIQKSAYGHVLSESPDMFRRRLEVYPDGCICLEQNGNVVAYRLFNPYCEKDVPVKLNDTGLVIPDDPDILYVHDICVDPSHEGQNHGLRLFYKGLRLARDLSLPKIMTVSLSGKIGFSSNGRWQQIRDAPEYGPTAQIVECNL